MSLNLTNRLSAITQDSAGTTHVVWLEGTNIWHAVYDPISQTWKDAQAIVNTAGQHIRSLNLIADSGLIIESGTSSGNTSTLIPGLAVVYQEGRENDSNFFHTAAQYNANGNLQWLPSPQALTADQVGDLEPRAVADNGFVTVVGQKVDLVKAQNQAIREDADLYSQAFQIYSNQFPTTPSALATPIATYTPQIAKDGVIQGSYIQGGQSAVTALTPATYQPLTLAETQSSSFQGWGANWTVSQTFDTNLTNLKLFEGMSSVPQSLLTPIFKKFNITGTLLGSSGNNPNLSFFGGGISTEGLLLNASMAIQLNKDEPGSNNTSSGNTGSSLNPAGNTTQLSRKPEISISAIAATLYTFDKSLGEDNLSYPLTVETGSVGLTVGFTFPLPIEGTPILFNLLGSAGLGMQWQLSPKDPQTYVSPVGAALSPTGGGSDTVLATLFNVPPLGAFAAIGLAVISDVTEVIELIFSDVDPDSNEAIELESLLFSIPVATGIDGGIKIPYVFEAIAGIQLSLVGTFGGTRAADNGAFQYDRDFSLGFPMNITIKLLGFLGGTIGIYPYFTWGDDPSSSDLLALNQASTDSPIAIVKGPLLEIQGLPINGNPTPDDFEVALTDPLGQVTKVPVFGVITQGDTTLLRLESALPVTTLNNESFSNITVTYQNNAPIPVINQSSNTFTYNYNPISGTNSNYQVTEQQILVAFNAILNPTITPALSRFDVTDVNGNSILIESVAVTPNSVILTLAGTPSGLYSVNYSSNGTGNLLTTADGGVITSFNIASNAPPSTSAQVNRTYSNIPAASGNTITTNPLLGSTVAQDYAEDSPPNLVVTDAGVLLAWSSDTPPITPISALLSGTQITLTFADSLNNDSSAQPGISQFQVLINNQATTIQDVFTSGNNVIITVNSNTIIDANDTVSVSYNIDATPGNSLNNLNLSDATDFAFWVPDFTMSVTPASSPTEAPMVLAGVAISNVLTLTFDQPLNPTNPPAPSQFRVTVNNANTVIDVTNVGVENNSVVLRLTAPIGQGDIITVIYGLGSGTLVNSNSIPVSPFTTSDILTTFTNPGTVIKTLLATPSTSGVSIADQTSIIGTSGLNYDPVVYFNQATNQVFAAWVNVDSSQIQNQAIPGQEYSNSEMINQALQSSTIYFSVASLDGLGTNSQTIPWSVATPIANQIGQDTNVTLGLGPDGLIMAAWLNTQLNNDTPTTTIYYSTLNSSAGTHPPAWSAPTALLPNINPDPFTPLTIGTINQNPAVFWTESAPASYRQLVLNAAPSVYLRLGERNGTVARNSGQFQAAANGTYSGNFTLGEMGALETTSNTGDPNPAVLFQGGDVTLNQPVPLADQAFTIELWFKLPNLPKESINLISASGLFGLGLEVDLDDASAPPLLTFGLNNLGNGDDAQIQASQTLASDVWYYVFGTYDGSSQTLSLYLNGVLARTVNNVEFDSFPTSATLVLAGNSTANNPVYLDEVAFYPKALTASDVNAADLTSANFQNLTGNQILEIIAGTSQIGNHYAAQYNQPIPPGPNTYYSVWDASSWQLPSQINPTPVIVPTQLASITIPIFDLVSATPAQAHTTITPNGIADVVYQITLSGQQNKIITGISVTSGSQAWGIGTDNTGKTLTGNQLGLLLGDTLLNSLNPDTQSFSHPIQGITEDLFLFVDLGSNTTTSPNPANVTVYFQNNDNPLTRNNISPYLIDAVSMGPGQIVTGTATVTEANDSSLALIDSGFIINSDNPAIGYVLASGFNSDGSLSYVAVGNRGYSDTQGNVITNGTVQILFSGSDILSGSGSLSTINLDGNSNGVLITNILDGGDNQRNLSLSLATGDIDGDGIPDLVIGAPNVGNFAGAVYVIYGSYLTSQKGQTIDVTNLSTTSNGMGFVVNGNAAEDLAGFSVVVGNFDGDAYDDIVFGAPMPKIVTEIGLVRFI
ncbi:SwmB domain-containing protein [Synechocystis sp. LKSZ1]|uniref:SwmB domain-containing protein n=1 Tax=Synechocystis sp. LKSZ1 TaxID=3144951 RepID=UPI00336C1E13